MTGTSFVDHLCYLCLVFVMLSCLFIAALWSPAGKGLTSWLLFVMFNCVSVTFPCGILDQIWFLIESIPDLCHRSYFGMKKRAIQHRTNDLYVRFCGYLWRIYDFSLSKQLISCPMFNIEI